ncbi:MAG TPA: hypothetical protein VFL93_11810 [Longimicrobiaceae bacterium]|nr:hypothetical protein [Longimicrobiaceae bacterium]
MRLNDKYNLEELGRRIQDARTSTPEQPAVFNAFAIDSVQSVVESCVDFQPGIPEPDRHGLVWKAITLAAAYPTINAEVVADSLRNAEVAYLRQPFKKYVVATSISVPYFARLARRTIRGATISFSRSHPAGFSRKAIAEDLRRLIVIDRPDEFTTTRVGVRARTPAAAVDQALESLDLLRSLWNFRINLRTLTRRQWGVTGPKPVNEIRLGPVHTLHTPGGKLVEGAFWYEPRHYQHGELYALEKDWDSVIKSENRIRKRLSQIRYASDLESLLIRYVRALDSTDFEVAYNKLWSVCERLVSSVGDYAPMIDRILFVFPNSERIYQKLILEHLRDVRNGMVHDDRSRQEIAIYLYQLKFFVETLFRFHFGNGARFRSLSTAGKFLDSPAERAVLKEQAQRIKLALRYKAPPAA